MEVFDDYFREPLRTQMEEAMSKSSRTLPLKKPDCVIRSSAINPTDEAFFLSVCLSQNI